MYICTYILALGSISAASLSPVVLDPSDDIQIDLHSVNETNLRSVLDQLLIWYSLNCSWLFANCSLFSVGYIYTARCWGCSWIISMIDLCENPFGLIWFSSLSEA